MSEHCGRGGFNTPSAEIFPHHHHNPVCPKCSTNSVEQIQYLFLTSVMIISLASGNQTFDFSPEVIHKWQQPRDSPSLAGIGPSYWACRFSISMLFSRSILLSRSLCFRISSIRISSDFISCSFSCSSKAFALSGRRGVSSLMPLT